MRKNQNETKLRIKFNPPGTNLLHLVGIELFGEFPFFFQTRDLNPIVCSLRLAICDALFFFRLKTVVFAPKYSPGSKSEITSKGKLRIKFNPTGPNLLQLVGITVFQGFFFFFRLAVSIIFFQIKTLFLGFYSC